MSEIGRTSFKYKYSVAYIGLMVLLNTLFTHIPLIHVLGSDVSPMDWTVGIVYVLRDFAQQELQHKVIIIMLVSGLLSLGLASQEIVVASMSAFLIAELVDWGVYTCTRRPMLQRILWSASLSTPIDSVVFLAVAHQFNTLGAAILSLAKIVGVLIVWLIWRNRDKCQSCDQAYRSL